MLVTRGDRTLLDAPAEAAPAEDVVTMDYYNRLPRIRLAAADAATAVTLDENDVRSLVEGALRHPHPYMRQVVLAAIWNDPRAFGEIFRFGLEAPEGFPEIRRIVAEALDKCRPMPEPAETGRTRPAAEALLPRMPLPAHLRRRDET